MRRLIIAATVVLVAVAVGMSVTHSAMSARPLCNNKIDDDGDGLVDYPRDPGCSSKGDRDETDPPPPAKAACENGKDDDGDGLVDYPADPGCVSLTDNDETDAIPSTCVPVQSHPSSAVGLEQMTRRIGLQTDIGTAIALGTGPECLTWAPPGYPNYVGYTVVPLNNTGQICTSLGGQNPGQPWICYLTAGQDYILQLDHRASTEEYGVDIDGGRNVVMIGGRIDGHQRTCCDRSDEAKDRGITWENQTGTVHMEGVWIDGAADGVTIRDPSHGGIYQFENLRISNLHAYQDNEVLAHPDIMQNFDGPAQIRIDHLTADSDWTGLSWFYGGAGVYPAQVHVKNVNLSGNLQPNTVMIWPDTTTRTLPDFGQFTYMNYTTTVNTASNCWVQTGWYSQTDRRRLYESYSFFDASGNQEPTQTAYRVTGYDGTILNGPPGNSTELGRRQGDYIEWPSVANMNGTRWYWGTPPGGDFVPSGVAGIGYVSPGYIS